MRRFVRWLLGVPQAFDLDQLQDVRQQLEELQDEHAHLVRRFQKLQGQVTRSWRRDVTAEPELELEEEETADERVLRMIQERKRG